MRTADCHDPKWITVSAMTKGLCTIVQTLKEGDEYRILDYGDWLTAGTVQVNLPLEDFKALLAMSPDIRLA